MKNNGGNSFVMDNMKKKGACEQITKLKIAAELFESPKLIATSVINQQEIYTSRKIIRKEIIPSKTTYPTERESSIFEKNKVPNNEHIPTTKDIGRRYDITT